MNKPSDINVVHKALFSQPEAYIYAVIDGAATADLRFKLYDWQPESACLWLGKLEPDMQEVAPYLVRLTPDDPFTDWLLNTGWGRRWNIFLVSHAPFAVIKRHLRRFLIINGPQGDSLYFRFYDPQVFADLDVMFDERQRALIFHKIAQVYFQRSTDKGVYLDSMRAPLANADEADHKSILRLKLTAERQALLDKRAHQRFIDERVLALRDSFPQSMMYYDDEALRQEVQEAQRQANQFNLYSCQDVSLYLSLCGYLGWHFIEQQQNHWMLSDFLNNELINPPSSRVNALIDHLMQD